MSCLAQYQKKKNHLKLIKKTQEDYSNGSNLVDNGGGKLLNMNTVKQVFFLILLTGRKKASRK